MSPFDLESPADLAGALRLLSVNGDEAKLIAGGTGLINLMKQRLVFPSLLVSLHRVPGLDYVKEADDQILLGACTSLATVERHPLIRNRLPMLSAALAEVASPRVRARATIGGAVAHGDPHQDTPVALIAYGAQAVVRSKEGSRTVPLDAFYSDYYETVLGPDELVTEVIVPALPERHAGCYMKYLPRSAEDYATVAVGGVVTLSENGRVESARVALGSVAATPVLANGVGSALLGQDLSVENVREIAVEAVIASLDPMSDARGSAEYKRAMAVVFTRRVLASLADQLGRSGGPVVNPQA